MKSFRQAAVARLKFLAGKKFDHECVEAFDKAFEAGDVTPAKARKASIESRKFEIDIFMGKDQEQSPDPESNPEPEHDPEPEPAT